jgi:hypothetical protein
MASSINNGKTCGICWEKEGLDIPFIGFDCNLHEDCCDVWTAITPKLRLIVHMMCVDKISCSNEKKYCYKLAAAELQGSITGRSIKSFYDAEGVRSLRSIVDDKVIDVVVNAFEEKYCSNVESVAEARLFKQKLGLEFYDEYDTKKTLVKKALPLVRGAIRNISKGKLFNDTYINDLVSTILTCEDNGLDFDKDNLDILSELLSELATQLAIKRECSVGIINIAILTICKCPDYYKKQLLEALEPHMTIERVGFMIIDQSKKIIEFSDNQNVQDAGIELIKKLLSLVQKGKCCEKLLDAAIDVAKLQVFNAGTIRNNIYLSFVFKLIEYCASNSNKTCKQTLSSDRFSFLSPSIRQKLTMSFAYMCSREG